MEEILIPDWVTRLRKTYEKDPVKWMWIGLTVLVVILIASMLYYVIDRQKKEASEIFSDGLYALSSGDYPSAAQSFDKIRASFRMSGFKDDATFFAASARFGLEDYKGAEELYREYLASNPPADFAMKAELGLGACIEMRNDLQGALQSYKAALAKYPGSFLKKAFEIRIARLSRTLGDAGTADAIYTSLETDTDGLWKEIARGNRRLVTVSDTQAADPNQR